MDPRKLERTTTPASRSVWAAAGLTFCLVGIVPGDAAAQTDTAAPWTPVEPLNGTLERVEVHGRSLEGNLAGDTPDRPVSVYLPPSYGTDVERRYPVVYLLHGFTDSDLNWMGWREHFVNVPSAFERALASGDAREMILVMPNAYTAFAGSMYSSSATTGDWEAYVADELVAYIDAHYRTIPERGSRGLSGHSMGGYGALRIAMRRPDVFAAVYALSPCCMAAPTAGAMADMELETITTFDDLQRSTFAAQIAFASAAAWSPNPQKPPFYLDLPTEEGDPRPDVYDRWAANAPLVTVHQHLPALRRFTAIALDSGAQDRSIAATVWEMSATLDAYGIEHTAEIYDPGNHISRVDERVESFALPFFSAHLRF